MNAKVLGINDEQTSCDHCGRKNLKKTVILEMSGEIVRYGVACAARALGVKSTVVETTASAVEYARKLSSKYDLEVVANAVWNRFGLLTNVKHGILFIAGQPVQLALPAPQSS